MINTSSWEKMNSPGVGMCFDTTGFIQFNVEKTCTKIWVGGLPNKVDLVEGFYTF